MMIGLCLYKIQKQDDGQSVIEVRPYNFYTFPRCYNKRFARDVSLTPRNVGFHKKVGTDYNRWIMEGVGYYDGKTQENLRKAVFGKKTLMKPNHGIYRGGDKRRFLFFKDKYKRFIRDGPRREVNMTKIMFLWRYDRAYQLL